MLKFRTFGAFYLLTIKSCARHGFRDFLMLRLILTFLFASFAFFLEAQSVLFGSAKPVLTKDLNIQEAFPYSPHLIVGAELEFWKLSEETPQDKIDRASIHLTIKKNGEMEKDDNGKVKYSYDANIRYTLDSLCIKYIVLVSDTHDYDVISNNKFYYWIGSNEIWFTNFKADDPKNNALINKAVKGIEDKTKNNFISSAERLRISEGLFNWIKANFPALKIIKEANAQVGSDLLNDFIK